MFFQSDSKYINQDIEYICRLFVEVLKIPIYFIDNNYDIFFSLSYGYANNPLHSDKKELFSQLFNENDPYNFPIVKSTKYHENYFAVKLNKDDVFIGTFIVGPSAYSYITAEAIDTLILDYRISLSYKKELINYYNSIRIIDYTRLINASLLLYYSIYNIKLNLMEVMEKNSSLTNVASKIKSDFEDHMSKNRQNISFHHSQANEKNMWLYIKEGNKEKLMEYMENPLDGEAGILSKNNPLRGQKNLAICNVTLATRAAMEGGLNSELAYTLSDLYIQGIEEINEIKDLQAFITGMLCDFTDKVHNLKEQKYSKVINACLNFIFKHLYEDISLPSLAAQVKLNANYLSGVFKKEVGISVSEYIQKERIEEAKRLLVSSKYSILDIAIWLNFHDQSHFTRSFKKLTGVTPKKYRDENMELYS